MTEEQLAAARLYTATEVVAMLRLKPTWLKNWITQERVPHLRAGGNRGVQFTQAHILEIGSMLPNCSAVTAAAEQPMTHGDQTVRRSRRRPPRGRRNRGGAPYPCLTSRRLWWTSPHGRS
jgi:hypothetical protein